MPKDFKIVEPEFVTRAKQSAVAAVEARFAREEKQRRTVERRARAKGCLAWLILLAIAAAAGLYLACRHYGIGVGEVNMRVHEMISSRRYERIEEMFRTAPLSYWKEAPDAIRPGMVAESTMYHALLPNAEGRILLELTALPGGEMTVRRLSALLDPVELPVQEFTRLTARTPYLIAVGGNVYFCSSKKTSIDKENFRRSLFAPRQQGGRRKGH